MSECVSGGGGGYLMTFRLNFTLVTQRSDTLGVQCAQATLGIAFVKIRKSRTLFA